MANKHSFRGPVLFGLPWWRKCSGIDLFVGGSYGKTIYVLCKYSVKSFAVLWPQRFGFCVGFLANTVSIYKCICLFS